MPYKIVSRSRKLWGNAMVGNMNTGELGEFFESLTISPCWGGVIYRVGEPTRPSPDCGPLAAFRTLQDVKDFKKRYGWRADPVFRCRVKKEMKEDSLFVTVNGEIERNIPTESLPSGTILCKEVTLIKLIP